MTRYQDSVFAKRLRAVRSDRGMTQDELADAAGVSRDSVRRWELGINTPGLDAACALADALACSVDDLARPFPATASELAAMTA